jgi:hypothetical protein
MLDQRKRKGESAMGKVMVEVDSKWMKVVHSPLYWIVVMFQGVSLSLAPLFIYFAGKGMVPHSLGWFVALLCFAIIFLVGFFYMRLGGEVISELRRTPKAEA